MSAELAVNLRPLTSSAPGQRALYPRAVGGQGACGEASDVEGKHESAEVAMHAHFGLSIRLLAPTLHGRRDGGDPERPPSPLRAFQALVCDAARRAGLQERAAAALRWLERLDAPTLITPPHRPGAGRSTKPLHYLWRLPARADAAVEAHRQALCEAARGIAALG